MKFLSKLLFFVNVLVPQERAVVPVPVPVPIPVPVPVFVPVFVPVPVPVPGPGPGPVLSHIFIQIKRFIRAGDPC